MSKIPQVLRNLTLIRFLKGFLSVFPVLYLLNMFCWILLGDTLAGPELTFGRGFIGFFLSLICIGLFVGIWIFEVEVVKDDR